MMLFRNICSLFVFACMAVRFVKALETDQIGKAILNCTELCMFICLFNYYILQ